MSVATEPWFLGPGTVHQPREFGFSEFAEQLEELPGLVPLILFSDFPPGSMSLPVLPNL